VVSSQEPEDAATLNTLAIMRSSRAIWELAFGIQGSRLMWDINAREETQQIMEKARQRL
jgi:hypothetical protein